VNSSGGGEEEGGRGNMKAEDMIIHLTRRKELKRDVPGPERPINEMEKLVVKTSTE